MVRKILSILAMFFCGVSFAADFSVESRNGVPQLLKDGEVIPPRMFMGNFYYGKYAKGINSPMIEEIKMASNSGAMITSIVVHGVWKNEEWEYKELDRVMTAVLKDNPNAYYLIRVRLNPPAWWGRQYPDEMMRLENGRSGGGASVASERYRKDVKEALRRVIRHLEKNYGKNIAGYHPAGANSSEWFYLGCQAKEFNGYDPATLIAWRKWLRAKYKTEQALQKAWKNSAVTFENATVPTGAERRGEKKRGLRSPDEAANILDFGTFQNESMVEIVLSLGQVIREEVGRRRLSVIFFGYVYELSPLWNGPGVSGHLALRKLLDSPYFDMITAPFSYNADRSRAGSGIAMSAAESIMKSGKLWLNEDDTYTHLAVQNNDNDCSKDIEGGAQNEEETLDILRRNLAVTLAGNYAIWWMDLYGNGRYKSQRLWDEMDIWAQKVEKDILQSPKPYRPEIAVFVDPVSLNCVSAAETSRSTTKEAVSLLRRNASKAGAAFGAWLLDDLPAAKAKLNIFSAAYALNKEQRAMLRKHATEAASLWVWAPGYIDLDTGRKSLKSVEEVTSFEVREVNHCTFRVKATLAGIQAGLPAEFGAKETVYPILSPKLRKGDSVLAVYSDNSPAVVMRPGKKISVFCGTTTVPTELIRYLAGQAGVHLYTEQDACVYSNGDFIAVYAPYDGEFSVNTGARAEYMDKLSGKRLGGGPLLKIQMKKGDIVLLTKAK
ncbi:MAG: beta-galactosidase [Lentisphaeria bacterium]|nr:beta-galactosidase [Lentisphaeria bacterium]